MEKAAMTVRVGGVKFRSEIPTSDPVYRGVEDELKNRVCPTRHVSSVTIRDSLKTRRKGKKHFVIEGCCDVFEGGSSEIEIYAGSIKLARGSGSREGARRILAHELGHADHMQEEAQGLLQDCKLTKEELEARAKRAERKVGW